MAVFLRLIVGLDHLQIMAGGSNILGAQIFQALGAVHILLALAGTSRLLGYHCIRLGVVASAVRSNKFVSFFLAYAWVVEPPVAWKVSEDWQLAKGSSVP